MSYYQHLSNHPNVIFVESNESDMIYTPFSLDLYCSVIDRLFSVVNNHCPVLSNKPITLIHNSYFESPESFKDIGLIFLNYPLRSDDGIYLVSFGQMLYQLSHELCHLLFIEKIDPRIRWLEEAICHAASFFFEDAICGNLKLGDITLPDNISLYASCQEYINVALAMPYTVFDLQQLNDFDSTLYKEYVKRPTKSYDDNFIASWIARKVKYRCNFWEALPYLHQVDMSQCSNLSQVFDAWCALAPSESTAALQRIKNLFTTSEVNDLHACQIED